MSKNVSALVNRPLTQHNRALTYAVVLLAHVGTGLANAQTGQTNAARVWTTARICDTIEAAAEQYGLPTATFARLIWTESRFDIKALSPKGAQGIAQFMPATAKERGLSDPYDPGIAIPASAALIADLRNDFGNLGLAAAAYNAGSSRVSRWLYGKSTLPFETQDYVAAITGKPVEFFRKRSKKSAAKPLKKGEKFASSCRRLPVLKTRFRGLDQGPRTPWGVQVAGHFSQSRAMRSWIRTRSRLGVVISDAKPALYRQRTPRGMKSRWTVRLGTQTRIGATRLCNRIRRIGGSCIVRKNR